MKVRLLVEVKARVKKILTSLCLCHPLRRLNMETFNLWDYFDPFLALRNQKVFVACTSETLTQLFFCAYND